MFCYGLLPRHGFIECSKWQYASLETNWFELPNSSRIFPPFRFPKPQCKPTKYSSQIYFQLEKLIAKNYFLNQSAKEAFRSYVRAYDAHQLKNIFDVGTFDLNKVALSYGFTVPPVVDLSKYPAPRHSMLLKTHKYSSILQKWVISCELGQRNASVAAVLENSKR